MENKDSSSTSLGAFLTPYRIANLSDGVFSIVMTLLILDLKMPDAQTFTNPQMNKKLIELWPKFEVFVISFLILGAIWIIHHRQFHFVRRSDETFLWINIFFLMSISFMPFATDIVGEYQNHKISGIIFTANMLIVHLLITLNWYYATKNRRLVNKNMTLDFINYWTRKSIIVTFIFTIAFGFSFLSVHLSYLMYVIVLFVIEAHKKDKTSPHPIKTR